MIFRASFLYPYVAGCATVYFFYHFFQCLWVTPIAVHHTPLKSRSGEVRDSYDYIIVGGGQSGLVLANRLSEDRGSSVLVIEYGYLYHDDPNIARPWRPFDPANNIYHNPKLMYNCTSTPQAGLNNRTTSVEAGATVGGGSTVNGQFFNRGAAEDYDAWERLGNSGWGWKGLLPYFKKSVTFTPPGKWLQEEFGTSYDIDVAYGGRGPIHASYPPWAWPGQKIQMAAWKEMGLKRRKEGAGGDAVGVFWVPRAQDPVTQTRSYAVTGHLDPALKRDNFELLTGHRVVKVHISKSMRAEGVLITPRRGFNGDKTTIKAKKEVIIAAGFHSPVILQRSGIGPRKLLENSGIDVKVDLPGVGMNLQDHPTSGVAFSYKSDLPLNPGFNGNPTAAALAELEFKNSRSGPYTGGHNLVAFVPGADFLPSTRSLQEAMQRQSPSDYLPAMYSNDSTLLKGYIAQAEHIFRAIAQRNSSLIETPLAGDAYALLILQKPLSRGTITIDPRDPYDSSPLVDFGTLHNPLDMEVLRHMIRFTRRLYKTNSMLKLNPEENSPGPDVQSDEGLEKYIRNNAGSSIGHESGTCAMMPLELGGVVGPDLKVYGVGGLRVVDASIFPLVPSTNLCATVYAVAEKAADIIKGRH